MSTKEKNIDNLYDNILSCCDITCSSCGKTGSLMNTDDVSAANQFYNEGWRAPKTNIYCPSCAIKKLKLKP